MIEIKTLTEYSPKIAADVRALLIELSRSGKDKGEIPEGWFLDVINSPYHDLILAMDGEKVVGMASMSIVMGSGIYKNAYLEDFVVSGSARENGIGGMLWEAMVNWAKEKGAKKMEFTCGNGREVAQNFYKKHGAEVYETNFFRVEL